MAQDSMLHPAQRHHEDSSVARWGGLAGIGGSMLFVVVFAIVVIFAGPEPAGPAGPISRFPEIRVARTVENGLYLAVLVMWVPLALALFHSQRRTRPASALFGTALNIFGLAVLAAGAIPHVVVARPNRPPYRGLHAGMGASRAGDATGCRAKLQARRNVR